MPAKTAFVIYGRDVDARAELSKFLQAVGIEELKFEDVASELGPSPFIADVVFDGIQKADAIIALFTPDEQSVLYDPVSGRSLAEQSTGARWQARPNVIFEAGVAYGKAGDDRSKQPILAVLGVDVTLFSDIGGVHFVRLDLPRGKLDLFEKLTIVAGPLTPTDANWETSAAAGDFGQCVRRRWRAFDEVEELMAFLENRKVNDEKRIPLLDVVRTVALADPDCDWRRLKARDFMDEVIKHFTVECTDDAYWWFVVYGFFRFHNIEYWGTTKGATWADSVDQAEIAGRGIALIERLRALP